MSVLDLKMRPLTVFDASNNAHREYYAEFVRRKTWGYCPVRFAVEGTSTSPRIEEVQMTEKEISDYMAGYEWNEQFGDKKDWG
jgi:hypothetical protein